MFLLLVDRKREEHRVVVVVLLYCYSSFILRLSMSKTWWRFGQKKHWGEYALPTTVNYAETPHI